jgi:hypothetical protein
LTISFTNKNYTNEKLLGAILLLTLGFAVNAHNEKQVSPEDQMNMVKSLIIK